MQWTTALLQEISCCCRSGAPLSGRSQWNMVKLRSFCPHARNSIRHCDGDVIPELIDHREHQLPNLVRRTGIFDRDRHVLTRLYLRSGCWTSTLVKHMDHLLLYRHHELECMHADCEHDVSVAHSRHDLELEVFRGTTEHQLFDLDH
jgi:hypothetical protein